MTWRREERETAVSAALVSGRSFDRRSGSAEDMAVVVRRRWLGFFMVFVGALSVCDGWETETLQGCPGALR